MRSAHNVAHVALEKIMGPKSEIYTLRDIALKVLLFD